MVSFPFVLSPFFRYELTAVLSLYTLIFILTGKLIVNVISKFEENFKSIIGPLEEISSNSSSKTLKLQTEKYFLEVTIQKCSALEVEAPTRQCCLGVIVKINFIYIICIYLRSLMILLVLVLWMSVYIYLGTFYTKMHTGIIELQLWWHYRTAGVLVVTILHIIMYCVNEGLLLFIHVYW